MAKKKTLWIGGGILVVSMVGCKAAFTFGTQDEVVATVIKTERITTGSGDSVTSKYMIYAEEETFENTDTIWFGKFNSSDIHGRVVPGKYKLKVYGWRIPFLSAYRNVVEAAPAG